MKARKRLALTANCCCLLLKTVLMVLAVLTSIFQKNRMINGLLRRVFQLSIQSGGNRSLRFLPMGGRFTLRQTVQAVWEVLTFGMCVLNPANGSLQKIWVHLSIQLGTTKRLLFIPMVRLFILHQKDTQVWAEKICF